MGFRTFQVLERALTFGKKYDILDEYDNLAYTAHRKLLSFSQYTRLIDSFGEEVFEIRNKPFSWKSSYFLYQDGQKVYHIFKKIIDIKPELFVESLTEADAFYVQGDLLRHEYQFQKEGINFASVSKKMIAISDQYTVRIKESYDERLVLATVLVLNLMKKKDN